MSAGLRRSQSAGRTDRTDPTDRVGRAVALAGLVVVYYVAAVIVFDRWRSHHWYGLTGDEPHYLTVAYSLAYDHSANVSRAYRHDVTAHTFPTIFPNRASLTPINMHIIQGAHGDFSVHGLGLPALLVPGLVINGINGAELTMVAISGIAVAIIGYVSLVRIPSRLLAAGTAFAVAVGMPLLSASAQIYPDVPAGVIALAVVAYLFLAAGPPAGHDDPERPPRTLRAGPHWVPSTLVVLAVAYEPWIHVKELIPAAVAAAGLAWVAWRSGLRRRAVGTLVVVGLSIVALFGYDLYAFGSILPGYTAGNSATGLDQSVMIFLGLHLDSVQGIFVQAPILVIGLAGLVRGCYRRQTWAYVAGVSYLAVMIPNATFSNTYGGLSFAGRFGWTAALILFVPCVDLLADLWGNHRAVVATGLAAEVVLQAVEFVHYTVDHYVLYSQISSGLQVAWARGYPTVWGRLGQLLPSYDDASWVWRYLPDVLAPVVVVAAVLALVADRRNEGSTSGNHRLSRGRVRRRPSLGGGSTRSGVARAIFAISAVGYLAAATLSSVPRPAIRIAGASLPRTEGQAVGTALMVAAPPGHLGYITFGPPYYLTPGRYHVTFVVQVRTPTPAPAPTSAAGSGRSGASRTSGAAWDVDINPGAQGSVSGPSEIVAHGSLPDSGGRAESVTADFSLPHATWTWAVQVRTELLDPATMEVDSVNLAR